MLCAIAAGASASTQTHMAMASGVKTNAESAEELWFTWLGLGLELALG